MHSFNFSLFIAGFRVVRVGQSGYLVWHAKKKKKKKKIRENHRVLYQLPKNSCQGISKDLQEKVRSFYKSDERS